MLLHESDMMAFSSPYNHQSRTVVKSAKLDEDLWGLADTYVKAIHTSEVLTLPDSNTPRQQDALDFFWEDNSISHIRNLICSPT